MDHRSLRRRRLVAEAVLIVVCLAAPLQAQRGGAQAPRPMPKAAASEDLTGYWISVITNSDQWTLRMVTPRKGDYHGVALTPAARKVADAWDPARVESAGEQCDAYGAPAIMQIPGRLHITWQDDRTLRIDTDTGMQTRLLHFGEPPQQGEPQLQGYSVAQWEVEGGRGTESGLGTAARVQGSALKVVTTHLRPGYLFKNGIPYSGHAVMTEFFNRITEPNNDVYLMVTEILEDPEYLNDPFVRTWHFKKLPDASGWNPSACTVR